VGAGQHLRAIGVERPVRQMAVGVDQHGQTPETRDPRTGEVAGRLGTAVLTRVPP
jgi:hypothetical protein